MNIKKYFEKNGIVYGIEQPNKLCGYATQCIKFENWEQATDWINNNTKFFRYLGTKTDAKHANIK